MSLQITSAIQKISEEKASFFFMSNQTIYMFMNECINEFIYTLQISLTSTLDQFNKLQITFN